MTEGGPVEIRYHGGSRDGELAGVRIKAAFVEGRKATCSRFGPPVTAGRWVPHAATTLALRSRRWVGLGGVGRSAIRSRLRGDEQSTLQLRSQWDLVVGT